MPEGTMKRILRFGPLIGLLLVGIGSAQRPSPGPTAVFKLLRGDVGIRGSDLSTLRSTGQPLAVLLPTHEKGEVAVAGVERIRVPLEFFLHAFTAMPTIKGGQRLLQIREFSSPPQEQDLQPLVLRPQDLQALSECMPGDCGIKLSRAMIERFRSEGLHHSALDDEFKKVILRYVNRYLAVGNAAMITYDDKTPPVRSLQEFRALLDEADWLNQTAPPLYQCLNSFSGAPCPQID